MEEWLNQLVTWLPGGKLYYFSLAVIAFMESLVAIGVIIPGSTIVVFAGFLALHGKEDIATLIWITSLGAFLGDFLSYALGARFGPVLLQTRLMQREKKFIRKAERFFVEHGGKSVFFGRFIGPVRGFVPFVAGCAGMPARAFVSYGVVSAILWGLAYPGLGYLAGVSWQNVQRWSGRMALVIGLALVATIFFTYLRKRFK